MSCANLANTARLSAPRRTIRATRGGFTRPKGFGHAQRIGSRVPYRRGRACGRSGLRRPRPRPAHAQHAGRLLPRRWDGFADFSRLLRRGAIPRWLILACDSVRGSDDRPPVWAYLAGPSVCCGWWRGPAACASGWVRGGRTVATAAVAPAVNRCYRHPRPRLNIRSSRPLALLGAARFVSRNVRLIHPYQILTTQGPDETH